MTKRNLLSGLAIVTLAGCMRTAPPPPRVPVPRGPEDGVAVKTFEPLRPLRQDAESQPGLSQIPPPMYDDQPLVTQAPPEQPMYVDAYERVGRPRMAIFVNRSVEGQMIPVDERRVIAGVDTTRETDGAVDLESRRSSDAYGRGNDRSTDASDRFKTDGPARVREHSEVYLAPGQYDEAQARSIDYAAIETALAEALAANGRVTLVSPTMARQRLSDEEVKDLQAGRRQVLREVANKLDADVLIQVQARPTKQTAQGLGVRVLVEAINTRGGESVARSFVDVPPPLDKPTINRHARFLARKTMYELAGSWNTMNTTPPTTRPGE